MRKETFKAAEYLRKLIADYDKADKDWNVVDFAERYANQRVVEELEEQLELAEHYNASVKLSERIHELKQD